MRTAAERAALRGSGLAKRESSSDDCEPPIVVSKEKGRTVASALQLRIPSPQSDAYAALLGALASVVLDSMDFSEPTFTLICFGLASAFFASFTFSTPLS